MGRKQVEKMREFLEQRGTLGLSYFHGKFFTICRADIIVSNQGAFLAEGVARRYDFDRADLGLAEQISLGRAVKSLYLKVLLYKVKNSTAPEEDRLCAENKLNSLAHGRIHLLMA